MSCTNSHNDSTMKFCPDCGIKMTVDLAAKLTELLKEVNTECKLTLFNPKNDDCMKQLLIKIVKNNLQIENNIIIHENEVIQMKQFILKYPFFTENIDDYETVDLFLIPHDFDNKYKNWLRMIPKDANIRQSTLLNKLIDKIDEIFLYKEDKELITQTLTNYLNKKKLISKCKYDIEDFIKYILQQYVKNNRDIVIPHHSGSRDTYKYNINKIIKGNHFKFCYYTPLNEIVICITDEHIIRMNGFWMANYLSDRLPISKEKIKEWFNERPLTWVRNTEIEDAYLATLQD